MGKIMIIKYMFSQDNKKVTLTTIKHNNFMLGISINNKYFTKDNLSEIISWMLENTSGQVCVLIVDTIQAINNEVLNHQSKEKALEKAMRDAKKINNKCNSIISSFSKENKDRIIILRWSDITTDPTYIKNQKIVINEFNHNLQFKEFIITFVKKQLGKITDRLDDIEIEYISHYLLNEIPELINGINYNNKVYDVCVYPGSFKELMQGIFSFKQLISKLDIKNNNKFIELYC